MVGEITTKVTPSGDEFLSVLTPDKTLVDIRFGFVADDIVGFENANAPCEPTLDMSHLKPMLKSERPGGSPGHTAGCRHDLCGTLQTLDQRRQIKQPIQQAKGSFANHLGRPM